MGILARIVVLGVLCLFVLTEPGRNALSSAIDWGSERVGEWGADRAEESLARIELRERLRGIEPICDGDFKPEGFEVSGGEAIALAVGKRKVGCDRVDLEPMDNGTWAVHVDAKGPNGCEFSAVIDGKTGEKLEGGGGCP